MWALAARLSVCAVLASFPAVCRPQYGGGGLCIIGPLPRFTLNNTDFFENFSLFGAAVFCDPSDLVCSLPWLATGAGGRRVHPMRALLAVRSRRGQGDLHEQRRVLSGCATRQQRCCRSAELTALYCAFASRTGATWFFSNSTCPRMPATASFAATENYVLADQKHENQIRNGMKIGHTACTEVSVLCCARSCESGCSVL